MYSVPEVAKLLDLHPKTVRRFMREGKLTATKIGREWRVSEMDLRAFTHADRGAQPLERAPAPPLASRVQVSAVIEVNEGPADEVSRISNSLVAVLNSKDPSFGASRYDLLYYPEIRKARFVLSGTPYFIRTIVELVEVLLRQDSATGSTEGLP
jgi:excisionase family DNA binding protein